MRPQAERSINSTAAPRLGGRGGGPAGLALRRIVRRRRRPGRDDRTLAAEPTSSDLDRPGRVGRAPQLLPLQVLDRSISAKRCARRRGGRLDTTAAARLEQADHAASSASASRNCWSPARWPRRSGDRRDVDRSSPDGRLGAARPRSSTQLDRRRRRRDADLSRPYPFFLAHPLEQGPRVARRPIADWQAEWKWDGIRAQLIRRGGETFLWSRGEELVTDRYPEIAALGACLPDGTVLDGEILPWNEGAVLPFAELQKRIGRKALTKKMLADIPVVLMAYDLLESGGDGLSRGTRRCATRRDARADRRRSRCTTGCVLSPRGRVGTWDDLRQLRAREPRSRRVEGLDAQAAGVALPRRPASAATGGSGRSSRYTIDAVLIAAQRGHGKRASLYTDYTFGVWDDGIAGADRQGLLRAHRRRDPPGRRLHPRQHGREVRPGPHASSPSWSSSSAFEGIQHSSRHKSGIAVRFPRILRAVPTRPPPRPTRSSRSAAFWPRGTMESGRIVTTDEHR